MKLYSDKSSQNSNELHVHVLLLHANVYIFLSMLTGSYVSDDHIVLTHSSTSCLFLFIHAVQF